MKSKKILFANFPADGHFNPLTGLAVHLKNSGYDVRWYTGIKFKEKIERLGIPFYPLKRAVDFSIGDPNEVFPGRADQKGTIAKLKFDIRHAFVLRGPEFLEDIREIDASFRFDLMIADNCFTGIPFVKQLLDKPVLAIGVVPLSETSKDLAPTGLAMTPSTSFAGRIRQNMLRMITDKLIFRESKKLIDEIYTQHGMKINKGNIFDTIYREADLVLQSGTPGFEYKRSDIGKNIRFAGPLLPHSGVKQTSYQLPGEYRKFRKKILVTQGTVERDVEKIIIPTIEAFKNSEVLVIVTTGGTQTEELRNRYPQSNVLIEDFIPFYDIMPECDAYVTNGGYGGVLLGIQNKLPMVVAGVHEGKNEINARVGFFKLGVNLRTEKPSAKQVKEGVERIFNDKQYKSNVVKLSREFAAYDPARLCGKYVKELFSREEKSTRATFLRMIQRNAEEKVY